MDPQQTNAFLSGLDEATIAVLNKAERLLGEMGESFRTEAREQAGRIRQAVADHDAALARSAFDADALCTAAFEASHELRGQAGTFGYELLTEICDSLCDVLERFQQEDVASRRQSALGQKLWAAVNSHAAAVSTIVEQDLKGDGGDVGRALTAELQRLRTLFADKAA